MTLPKLARQAPGAFAHMDATAAVRNHTCVSEAVSVLSAPTCRHPLRQPTVQALLPALTHHAKLAVLDASGCCLSDAAGTRAASLLRAQAATAAQEAWARTLRGSGSSSSNRRPSSASRAGSFQDGRLLRRAEAGWQGGVSVLDPAAATPATTAAAAGALAELCADRAGLQVVDFSNNQVW